MLSKTFPVIPGSCQEIQRTQQGNPWGSNKQAGGKEEDACCPCMDRSMQSALSFPSSCSILGHAGPRPPPAGVPPRYRKAVFVEYPDGSFTQPKLKPAWMGKEHLQCGEHQQSLTATRLILGWVLAALQPGAGKQLGGSRDGRAPGGAEGLAGADAVDAAMLHERQPLTGFVESHDPLGLLAGCELPDPSCLTLLPYPLQAF